jgi:CRP/FNR family cyclic AMP-dependent transcriptional regulator
VNKKASWPALSDSKSIRTGPALDAEPVDEPDAIDPSSAAAHSHARELRPTLGSLLGEVSLFATLSRDVVEELARSAAVTEYPKGSLIVQQGEPGGSLLIVESGFVELFLERQDAPPVTLSTYGRGEFFGELSLFDGKPRSASARAATQCRIVRLHRDVVMPQMTLPMLTGLLSAVATRVRRTDETVAQLSDKVYRAAYSHVHAAVSVELDSIKTLYQRTEHLAADTLDRAEKRADAVLERADQTVSQVGDQFARDRNKLMKVGRVFLAIFSAVGIGGAGWALTVLREGNAIHQAHDEIEEIRKGFEAQHQEMRDAARSLRVVKETMTGLRAAREAAELGQPVSSVARLKRLAANYEPAKAELMARYVMAPGDEARDESLEPEVVFEAVNAYLTLVSEGSVGQQLTLNPKERSALSNALFYVLEDLPAGGGDASRSTESRRVFERKLRDTWRWLDGTLGDAERGSLRLRLGVIVSDARRSVPTRLNAALLFVEAGKDDRLKAKKARQVAIGVLTKALGNDGMGSSLPSALALAKLGLRIGWDELMKRPGGADIRYEAAALLAQEGRDGVVRLAKTHQPHTPQSELLASIRAPIQAHIARAPNCFEQRYARLLVTCLDGPCQRPSDDEPLGGECTDQFAAQ